MLLGSETALLRMSHVLLGMIVGRYELGMEVQSRRSWDAGSRLGHGKGVQINISLSQKLLLTEPSNVCIRTVLHECILTICTSHAALSETRANQCLCKVLFLILVWLSVESKKNKKSKAKNPTDPKPLVSTKSQQIDVALLQHFSVWVCKAALLQFHYAAGKIHPENKSLLIWNGFPVYCDNFLSDSCLAGCPKLTF